ncbi:nucleolar protein 14 [Ephemerocybe angulata]|uniref:Nucleolar protein 14 n=1 Tax=Ephemerocybe angulata TaxID=980116 RepID=A0A8H6MAH0_9AGAR|nr:nucleolar protein 14 [Tulosesus angulatus]
MAKGSQLSQLKSALNQAGVIGQKPSGKKRKRSAAPLEKDKLKTAAKLEEIHRRLNPFDEKVTKLKHNVGGRKLKGVTGKPAKSKQAGLEQRKRTLLKEWEDKDRAGGIVDRRFGENDPTMSLEERMLERFTRERQRASKSAAFNIEDEEELTHYGQSLSRLDDFDDVALRSEDDEEEELASRKIDGEVVSRTHFGGFGEAEDEDEDEEGPARKKSKAEVMAEVMAKSKEHKLRRQMEKDVEETIRAELDDQFADLRDLLFTPKPAQDAPESATLEKAGGATDTDMLDPESQDNSYDQRVRELAFDKRSKPKDRTKTEEELALEAKDTLEKAERRRQRRMEGLEESDSGDDLEDDFDDEEWGGLGAGLAGAGADEDEVSDDDSGSEEDEDEEGDDFEGSEESEAEEGEHEDLVPVARKDKGKGKAKSFLEIIENIEDKDPSDPLHHTSLAPDNKFKLQSLANVLVDHILYVSAITPPKLNVITMLYPHLNAIIRTKNLKRGLSKGALDPESKSWPTLAELSLLRVIPQFWPTSDLNHAVVSPTRVLLGSYLGLCRVRSLGDIASGLFLCTLWLQYEALSKRLVPEAVNFLINAILHIAPHSFQIYPAPNLPELLEAEANDEQAKATLLGLALNLLGRFADMYKGLDGFIELLEPVHVVLQGVDGKKLAQNNQSKLASLVESLGRLLRFAREARQPLRLQAHKPIPIATYVPKFESSSSNFIRSRDPDFEKNEAAKLKNQYKQERKGAIRELRKDTRFLASVEHQKQVQKDKAYYDTMKKAFTSIEGERAEQKQMEKEKARDKRRKGKK